MNTSNDDLLRHSKLRIGGLILLIGFFLAEIFFPLFFQPFSVHQKAILQTIFLFLVFALIITTAIDLVKIRKSLESESTPDSWQGIVKPVSSKQAGIYFMIAAICSLLGFIWITYEWYTQGYQILTDGDPKSFYREINYSYLWIVSTLVAFLFNYGKNFLLIRQGNRPIIGWTQSKLHIWQDQKTQFSIEDIKIFRLIGDAMRGQLVIEGKDSKVEISLSPFEKNALKDFFQHMLKVVPEEAWKIRQEYHPELELRAKGESS
ncbi:MAG: hypothetical protein MRZ79_04610 [Bacteroidia bacterium]|nr:hypothetical protein [Bacteroidia bacterium]